MLRYLCHFVLMRFSLLRLSKANRLLTFIACFFTWLPACSHAGKAITVSYASLPGVPKEQTSLDLYPCPSRADTLVVYVHGGAWIRGDKANVHSMPSYFSSNNICFASVNYPLISPDGKPLIDEQVRALTELNAWLESAPGQTFHPRPFKNITIIGHSAGSHLVALVDKRKGWNPNVRNLILMDSSSYDIEAKFQQSSQRYRTLMSTLLRLDMYSSDEYAVVFKNYSPASLPPVARSISSFLNVFLLTSQQPIALSSAISLQDSYRLNPGYRVSLHKINWKHSDFPRKIGVNEAVSRKILEAIESDSSK